MVQTVVTQRVWGVMGEGCLCPRGQCEQRGAHGGCHTCPGERLVALVTWGWGWTEADARKRCRQVEPSMWEFLGAEG